MSGYVIIKEKKFIPFISEEKITAAVKRLADEVSRELAEQFPVFIVVLNGAFMFASDLLKQINIPCEIRFIKLASYQGTESTGRVNEVLGLDADISGRSVVIIEDIVDSGLTVAALTEKLSGLKAGEIRTVALLFKPERCRADVKPAHVGFEVPDRFVVGYGMDYEEQGRNLREVHVLE